MATIFYSWQSDIPSSINRNFIKDALQKAIKEVTESLGLDEAPRLEQDTSGIPGSPEIVNSILSKIDSCAVFVSDLTIVAHTDNYEPTPNPNVLIEYGYAMKTIGSKCMISLMNEAFGSPEDSLPFDLKHRRWPIRYNLTENASSDTRKEQKERLISQLITALQTIIEVGLLDSTQEPVKHVQPVWKSSSFISDNEVVAKAISPSSPGAGRDIVWFNGPQAFIRIIPSTTHDSWSPLELTHLIKSGGLLPMGNRGDSTWILRNSRGVVFLHGQDDRKPDTYIKALCFTQVFRTGEIWGIEGYSLGEEYLSERYATPIKYIASRFIENLFTDTLSNYLQWAESSLNLDIPLKYIIGLSGVEEYPISINSQTISGYCVDDQITATGEIEDYKINIDDILIPFFKKIWESCGYNRPDRQQ